MQSLECRSTTPTLLLFAGGQSTTKHSGEVYVAVSGDIVTEFLVGVDLFSTKGVKIKIFHEWL
jgi:hypothetical protein